MFATSRFKIKSSTLRTTIEDICNLILALQRASCKQIHLANKFLFAALIFLLHKVVPDLEQSIASGEQNNNKNVTFITTVIAVTLIRL